MSKLREREKELIPGDVLLVFHRVRDEDGLVMIEFCRGEHVKGETSMADENDAAPLLMRLVTNNTALLDLIIAQLELAKAEILKPTLELVGAK